MIKVKPLLPSLRERKRYLVFEIFSDKPIKDSGLVQRQLWYEIKQFIGDLGLAQVRPRFLPEKFNQKTQRGIIRLNHTKINLLKAALLFVQHIEKEPVIMRSIAVSGTLRKASTYLKGG